MNRKMQMTTGVVLALGLAAAPSHGVLSSGPGGQGVTVGSSDLITGLDYSDTFTLGTGTRVGLAANAFPVPAPALAVEFNNGNPPRAWTGSKWSISQDASPINGGTIYPGGSGAGSATGMTQTGGPVDYGLEYGVRSNYVLQFDAVQTNDRVNITTGTIRDAIGAGGANRGLSVFVRADSTVGTPHGAFPITGLPGIGIYNGVTEAIVYDTPTGNGTPGVDPLLMAGAANNQWNNYAVRFDQARRELDIYVNESLVKSLDLDVFAGGAYRLFSNKAVTAGASGNDRTWTDNVQIGAAAAQPFDKLPSINPQYMETYTLGQNGRVDGTFNDNSGGAYNVEQTFGNPPATMTPFSAFSFQAGNATHVGALSSVGNPGSDSGVGETGGGDFRIPYGLSTSYIVAADAILPADDRFDISTSSTTSGSLFDPNSLNVFFRRDTATQAFGSIGLHSAAAGETMLLAPGELGIDDQDWHNFAVWFDEDILRVYVDQMLRSEVDLDTFAGGAYSGYSNAAVGLGGTFVTYYDNFVVGTAAVVVPEPATMTLLGLTMALAFARRRREA